MSYVHNHLVVWIVLVWEINKSGGAGVSWLDKRSSTIAQVSRRAEKAVRRASRVAASVGHTRRTQCRLVDRPPDVARRRRRPGQLAGSSADQENGHIRRHVAESPEPHLQSNGTARRRLLSLALMLRHNASGVTGATTRQRLERRQINDQKIQVELKQSNVVEGVIVGYDESADAARRNVVRRLRLEMPNVETGSRALRSAAMFAGGDVSQMWRRSTTDAALRTQSLD